jgi:hypothetical protein
MTKQVALTDINLVKTTTYQTGKLLPTTADTESMQSILQRALKPSFEKSSIDTRFENLYGFLINPPLYTFDDFKNLLSKMETQANQKLSEFETALTSELSKKIQEKVGFSPTVRNICAVIMASAEGFIRLLDDVHTNAWNVKYDPVRKNAILNNPSSAPGTDTEGDVKISPTAESSNQGLVNGQIPVYPWPQFFVETPEPSVDDEYIVYVP